MPDADPMASQPQLAPEVPHSESAAVSTQVFGFSLQSSTRPLLPVERYQCIDKPIAEHCIPKVWAHFS
eukprot:4843841-Amphidinium_carterae.1